MSNMSIWESVCTTNTKYTKKVNQRGGYTSICPQYQAREATKKFGSYGHAWGLCSTEFDFSLFEMTGMVIHKAVFFYLHDGKRNEFPLTNATTVMSGTRPDVDWAKKVETNTVSKALSKLGFNADVFMGEFDDMEYIIELQNNEAIESAANKEEEKAKQAMALIADSERVIAQINEAKSLSVVEGLYKAMARRLGDKNKAQLIKLVKAKDDAKERLND